jgi:pantoate--beta-alanine ligase
MTPRPARSEVNRGDTRRGDRTSATTRELAVVRRTEDFRAALQPWRTAGESIGLVPTMGALHAGHMALVRAARAECARVVATLFVNPLQFDRAADLEAYPRDEAGDRAMLAAAGADLLFAPPAAEMYPDGFATAVSVSGLTACLCGRSRPGHMTGVATVVTKLLLQALPAVAYFGEKDYQQMLVVRRLVRDLAIPVRIVAVATVRDADGLALSSRNARLTADERRRAPAMYHALQTVAGRLLAGGDTEAELAWGREAILRGGFDRVDYFELRRDDTLATLAHLEPPARLFAAAWLGSTRLIDNVPVC